MAFRAAAQNPGTLDTSFQQVDLANARYFTELPDKTILISGESLAFTAPKFARVAIVRLRPNGSVDPGFNFTGDPNTVSGHIVRTDGRILVYGSFTTLSGHPTHGVAMLDDAGAVDPSFKVETNSGVRAILVLSVPNGALYIGYQNGLLIRVDSKGTADAGFKPNPQLGNGTFGAILQPSGKIVVVQDSKIFRLNLDGSRDSSYTESTYTFVNPDLGRYASTPEGAVYVSAGNRRFAGGEPRTIARIKVDGGLDTDLSRSGSAVSICSRTRRSQVIGSAN